MSTSVLPDDSVEPTPPSTPPERRRTKPGGGLFRAFWRWHFYASFLVVPILLVLASTGLVYLLRFQIEPLLHADLMRVEQPADVDFTQPYAAQQNAVERAYPDASIASMTEPASSEESTRFSLTLPDGEPRDVFVDPWRAEVLGGLNPDTTVSGYAVRLHADLMGGPWAEHLIELAACWSIVMALTGYYLFWKGRTARKRARRKLRSRHAAIGALVGVGLLTLLISGLPWTGFWGAKVQQFATANGSSLWSTDPGATSNPTSALDESLPHSHAHEVPWGMGKSEVPKAHGKGVSVANVDTAIEVADREGLRHPMTVTIPGAGGGGHGGHSGGGSEVFSVIGYAFDAPSDERTVHVDPTSGAVLSTYGFDNYPALAKVVSHGIGLHEGRSLGLWTFWGALLMCVGIIALCVTGPLMWWRRRPKGRSMGAPRGRLPVRSAPVLVVGLVVLGVVLPFFGASVLAILAVDQVVLRRVPALREFFNVT